MDSKRLRKVEEIYHAAADRSAGEREAFLDEACANDAGLRCQLVELLSFDDVADSFIDNPPDALAAEMFAGDQPAETLIGKRIGRYEIRQLVGVGGMGEVYLAHDTQLNREVALKLLPHSMFEDVGRLKRFKHEAQAASALNHPNILTIHEFGNENGSDYIVSEFIDGLTLRGKMRDGALPLSDVLDICIQIASALGAAHAAGIIHRDVKPENIMVRRDGIIKVLDFGLAKLTADDSSNPVKRDEDATLFKTEPGMVMGTVGYMSPEQARGVKVDGRSDVWSMGVIVYELLTTHRPFEGETQTDVLVAILNDPVPMHADIVRNVPTELQQVIAKALAKDADQRYTTIKELAADLANIKQRLVFDAESERTENNRPTVDNRWPKQRKPPSDPSAFVDSRNAPSASATRGFTRRRLLILLIAFAAAAAAGIFYLRPSSEQPVSRAAIPQQPLASSAAEAQPARTLAYSLTVQSFTDGRYKEPFILSGEMLFRNKDRIRINVKSPEAGYLYILNQGPVTGEVGTRYNILFPSPTANNGSSSLAVGQEVRIPEGSWFELDEKEGSELVWLVWSADQLADLESAKQYANPVDKGKIKDQNLNQAIAGILEIHKGRSTTVRDDDRQESRVTGNSDIVARAIRLEHH